MPTLVKYMPHLHIYGTDLDFLIHSQGLPEVTQQAIFILLVKRPCLFQHVPLLNARP